MSGYAGSQDAAREARLDVCFRCEAVYRFRQTADLPGLVTDGHCRPRAGLRGDVLWRNFPIRCPALRASPCAARHLEAGLADGAHLVHMRLTDQRGTKDRENQERHHHHTWRRGPPRLHRNGWYGPVSIFVGRSGHVPTVPRHRVLPEAFLDTARGRVRSFPGSSLGTCTHDHGSARCRSFPGDRTSGTRCVARGVARIRTGCGQRGTRIDCESEGFGGAVGVVEFYNAGLQHCFISADSAEIAVLDSGAFGGAKRRATQSRPPAGEAGRADVRTVFTAALSAR